MRKKPTLNEKDLQAIELINQGKYSYKEIAITVGYAPDTLYKLIEGDESAGPRGILFKAEIKKLHRKYAEEIKEILNDNKRKALRIINGVLTRILALDYTTNEDAALVVTVLNALNKAPTVEINSTSYNFYKNLTQEEMLHEFNRITSLVRGPSVRRGIPQVGQGGTGSVPELIESGRGHDKE